MSEKTLVQHMAEVMKEVGYVQKDATNDFQRYTYASAQAVFDKVRKELSERGIAVCGDVELVASEIVGEKAKHLVVAKHTLTFNKGTDKLSVSALGEGIDAGDKASMKANTAAVKYCLAKAFLISWGDDPEADIATDGQEDNFKVTEVWLPTCEKASNASAEKFAPWWKKYGDQIKKECGKAGAAKVYEMYQTYLARLKAEANDSA
jgi:hypothetical protein